MCMASSGPMLKILIKRVSYFSLVAESNTIVKLSLSNCHNQIVYNCMGLSYTLNCCE